MENTEKIRKLNELAIQFQALKSSGSLDLSSEATARSWIEGLLTIFGWNCRDPYEVDQEVTLGPAEEAHLQEIESSHKRPDYLLCAKSKSLVFIDAKKIGLTIKDSKKSAFQIRSYGWSAGHPYAVITNFNEFAIYDCRYKPNKDQAADVARIFYCTFDKFVEQFDVLRRHIERDFVLSGEAFDFYLQGQRPSGTKKLDEDFSEHIREWRLKFANDIFSSKPTISIEGLSESTQLLIDRFIFCRVAEGLKIVEADTLLNLSKQSKPWSAIKGYFENQCKEQFAGFLFSNAEALRGVGLSDKIIKEFVESLYYPSPYRFDVITPVLLGNIYERYLGRKLEFKGKKVIDDFKEEYQKTKGAVYTPEYVVRSICEKTIEPLAKGLNVREIKDLKILDPSCGSGSFLLGVFDYIQSLMVSKFTANKLTEKERRLFWVNPRSGKVQLRINAKREIINTNIYGVDIDPQAVEVARLSLSLKALESASLEPIALRELGLLDSLLIDGIGNNVKLGNSLVDSRIFAFADGLNDKTKKELKISSGLRQNLEVLKKLKVFDWDRAENFKSILDSGGFDAVVGNPPYIEIKHYKEHSPVMHHYLSESEHFKSCGSGKTDISMPFIERSLNVLKPTGRLGFIIQTRFFKTKYGESARGMLSKSASLEQIFDFGSLRVFEDRTTYTSIVVCNKAAAKSVQYVRIDNLNQAEQKLSNASSFSLLNFSISNQLGSDPWFFVHPDLKAFRDSVMARNPKIQDFGDSFSVNVGLQVLFKKCYLIKGRAALGYVIGKNLLGDDTKVERDSCKAFVMNRELFPFKKIDAESFVIFPYDIVLIEDKKKKPNTKRRECQALDFPKFSERYPLAGKYLASKESVIKDQENGVETLPGKKWHLYKYEKNHVLQSLPKILIPSTCVDTTAIFDENGEFYQDNVRVNSIVIEGANSGHYKALCAIINSRVFDCLAKVTSEALDNGYIQFNKQFITPVPMPVARVMNDEVLCQKLASAYDDMNSLANQFANAADSESKQAAENALASAETSLNEIVATEAYQLTDPEKQTLERFATRMALSKYIDFIKGSDVEDTDETDVAESA